MGANSSYRSVMSEINVTPLVDVMLVLLIIFMVTAPMMQQGIEVDLPESGPSPIKPSNEEPLIVSVTSDGKLYVGRESITPPELQAYLQRQLRDRPTAPVLVRADGEARYEDIVKALDGVQSAGVGQLGLVTEPFAGFALASEE